MGTRSIEEIQQRIIDELAKELQIDRENIIPSTPFERYGLDSMAAVNLMASLEEWLGAELSPSLPFKYRSIETLARHLGTLD